MRLVFDTNVLIAAFITRGVCASLFEHCVRRHHVVCSDFILGELRRHLVSKFKSTPEQSDAAVDLVRSVATVVTPAGLQAPACRDPDDDFILGTAIAGAAACIVTGDNDLLVLGSYGGIPILRPNQFAEFESKQA